VKMYRNTRELLIEYGPVLVRKSANEEVTFNSVDEFKYYGESFASGALNGKEYLNYNPDMKIHLDSALGIKEWTGPVAKYETIINAHDQLRDRKADPLYGLSGQDLQDETNRLAKISAWRNKMLEFRNASNADGLSKVSLDQVETYLDNQYDLTDLDAALLTLNNAGTAGEVRDALIPAFLEVRKMMNKSKLVDLRIVKALLANILEPEV